MLKDGHIALRQIDEPVFTANAMGGSTLYKYSGGTYVEHGTLGICGTYNGSNYILTAGHMVSNGNDSTSQTIYYGSGSAYSANNTDDNSYIGFHNNGYGDFALIPLSSRMTPTNYVKTGSSSYVTISNIEFNGTDALNIIAEGSTVFKYGITTGFQSGTLREQAYTLTVGDMQIRGLRRVESSTEFVGPGDSGGPFWCIDSNGRRRLIGVSSSAELGGNELGFIAYYSPFYLVPSSFSIYS